MLFLSQTYNEFLNSTGLETFIKAPPLASKPAVKTLGLQTNGKLNKNITYLEIEGQVASVQLK